MQKIEPKLSLALNLFKFCGIYFDKFEIGSQKFRRKFQFWPIWMFYVHLVILSPLVFFKSFSVMLGYMKIKENFMTVLTMSVHMVSGIICVLNTFLHRHKLKSWCNLIDQIDDYIVRFLNVSIDYNRENWNQLIKILVTGTVNIFLGLIASSSNFTLSKDFKLVSTMGFYYIMLNQINGHKYIYFVSIIINRMKIIIENYNLIKNDESELKTLMQIYSTLWKLSEKVGKIFNFQMILNILCYFVNFVFFGHLLAVDIAKDNFNAVHFVTLFAPHLFLGFYCYHGEQFRKIVSN